MLTDVKPDSSLTFPSGRTVETCRADAEALWPILRHADFDSLAQVLDAVARENGVNAPWDQALVQLQPQGDWDWPKQGVCRCACGSGDVYAECCGALLYGESVDLEALLEVLSADDDPLPTVTRLIGAVQTLDITLSLDELLASDRAVVEDFLRQHSDKKITAYQEYWPITGLERIQSRVMGWYYRLRQRGIGFRVLHDDSTGYVLWLFALETGVD